MGRVRHFSKLSDLILRSIAQAMRLEGWPRIAAVQAAILRDERKSALLRMRSGSFGIDPLRIHPDHVGNVADAVARQQLREAGGDRTDHAGALIDQRGQ
jgi:hypothetical protein